MQGTKNEGNYRVQDKVCILCGQYQGKKGRIQMLQDALADVKLYGGEIIQISTQDLTNLSLAARKAWQTMRSNDHSSKDDL